MSSKATSERLRLGAIDRSRPYSFDLVPDATVRAALADELDLSALRKLRFTGQLIPEGRADWRLEATLGATMVQPCGITLEPVTTRVDDPVTRAYQADLQVADLPAEQEMPEDDSIEPLPDTLDLAAVMAEALLLAVPPFPRAPGAEIGQVSVTEPGRTAMSDDDARPFAGLRDALKGSDD
ncbi:DUF177 domain-containing protein [Maribius pontilimi]|uniref:DUF177 domain-containing protein n=1 Tax=Palleronia pontilimi TaxID=1964209 RepID=A0A934IIG5_9RHOB|nr:DUF177 domain-containing protein [Palleronia pontilimi]MBJ3763496.1 DUF177 domain-containing protein [Palleronia pontilimi]